MARTLGAALALAAFGVAFAAAALGRPLLVADDHPGQLYRLVHVLTLGPAPWAWNTGWFAGYPELQFYPPAFAYAGALLHRASLGVLSVAAAYQTLLWLTYLLPGLAALLALARLTGDGRLALPGAFVALTLSAGLASGVEGGIHIGMAPARLGWALLPLLVAALARWTDAGGRFPFETATPLLALVVLTHPAHLPAAVALVAICAAVATPRGRRLAAAAAALALAASLTAFWTLPLLARLGETRALAWGELALGPALRDHPLLIVLLALAALARPLARTRAQEAVALWPWLAGALVALDAIALEPLGVRWLPADRVADGAWLAVILAAGLTVARGLEALRRGPRAVWAPAAILALVLVSLPGRTLALWPRALEWPKYEETVRGLRLDALWAALRAAPPGRVLFVRSSVPLVYATRDTNWWRPHTHLWALTPLAAGRGIVNGTFTHPSPVAALVYRGSAGPGAITSLVERLDGRSLFGLPLESLDAAALARYADRLGVSVVVALDEDAPRLAGLDDGAAFERRTPVGPFLVWQRRAPVTLPRSAGHGRWELTLDGRAGEWASARVAYYPLWRAEIDGTGLPTRRGELGDLEVKLDRGGGAALLAYAAGIPEIAGIVMTVAGLLAWSVTSWVSALRAGPRRAPSAS